MTRQTFQTSMAVLSSMWPDRIPPDQAAGRAVLEAYWLALGDLDGAVFERAIARCLRECTYCPRPAEIVQRYEAVLTESGALPPGSDDAWGQVLLAVGRDWHPDLGWIAVHPDYPHLGRVGGMPCPLAPTVRKAVEEVGGMLRIATTDQSEMGWLRKEFQQQYEAIRRDERRRVLEEPTLLPVPQRPALPAGRAAA